MEPNNDAIVAAAHAISVLGWASMLAAVAWHLVDRWRLP